MAEDLNSLHLADLHERAQRLGVPRFRLLDRDDLIDAIGSASADDDGGGESALGLRVRRAAGQAPQPPRDPRRPGPGRPRSRPGSGEGARAGAAAPTIPRMRTSPTRTWRPRT